MAFVAVSEKVAAPVAPVALADAVRLPELIGVAVTDAWPFDPVVTVVPEKPRPLPEKVTLTPATGSPLESFTMTTKGIENAEPYVVVWPEPETTAMLAAVPPLMVSVSVPLLTE